MGLVNGIEKVTKSEGFDLNRLKAMVKTFNEAGLVEKKIKMVAVKTEVMVSEFMTTVEAVPEDREKDIPKEVLDLYNAYADVIDDKVKDLAVPGPAPQEPPTKKEKKASSEKKTGGKEGSLNFQILGMKKQGKPKEEIAKEAVGLLKAKRPDKDDSWIVKRVKSKLAFLKI